MANNKQAVGLACQLAYEYENVGWEHIDDMMATYEDERPPCSGNDLYDLTMEAVKLKDDGKTYQQASKVLCSQ